MATFIFSTSTSGRGPATMSPDAYNSYLQGLTARLQAEYEARRQHERENPLRPSRVEVPANLPITVKKVDQNIGENSMKHYTDKYELTKQDPVPRLVIRRGQAFKLTISFHREFDSQKDKIAFEFNYGPDPKLGKRTKVELNMSSKYGNTKDWTCKLDSSYGKKIEVSVIPACDTMAGMWKMKVFTTLSNDPKKKVIYEVLEDIYIIFNPWCKDDTVFLEDEKLRKEYVLNDSGKIWMGTHNNQNGRRWMFGQFDDVILPACMLIFERVRLDPATRGNPVRVVRSISAGVNSNDEGGVLIGMWATNPEDYKDGKAPWEWTGSVAILEEYMKSGGKSVKYGQCWVFSGVTTTLCRALGIPCRSVTNFVSAHDTDESLTIDKYFTEDGESLKHSDSIWNFHVWNDVWMARPDLKPGYGGWQAIDATPQERSEGRFQAGPCSLVAIRRGHIGHQFDTPFLFAEVNADIVHWQAIGADYKKIKTEKYHVGRSIMTKAPDVDDDFSDRDGEDIVHEYKPMEGSDEERLSVLNAYRNRSDYERYDMPDPEKEDMTFDLLELETVMIGQNFDIMFHIRSKSAEERPVTIVLSCSTILYTGVPSKEVKKRKFNLTVKPGAELPLRLTITPQDYLDKLVDHCLLKIYAVAKVEGTQQVYSEEDDFTIIKPKLAIETSENPRAGESVQVNLSFKNPLPYPLTECKLSIEGPGLSRPKFIELKNVQIDEVMTYTETLTPRDSGTFKIVAVFNSKELTDVIGSKTVEIED